MNHNGWIKYHSNKITRSFDKCPLSWYKTPLNDMIGAAVIYNNLIAELRCGWGEYHYSDGFEYYAGNIQITERRVQFKTVNGKWLTKEIDIKLGQVKTYIAENKI